MNIDDVRDMLRDENPDALLADGFEAAIVGIGRRCGQPTVAVYSRERCLRVLQERDGLSREEAEEYFEFNVQGAWLGEHTPVMLVEPEVEAEGVETLEAGEEA